MPQEHRVEQGECISSIAAQYGLLPDTIWNDPANAQLKGARKNGNVLYEGDIVTIPDKRPKEETRGSDARHRFRRKGVPAMLRIVLLDEQERPRDKLPYVLVIDGAERRGTTDRSGRLQEPIPPDARQGTLLLGQNRDEEIPLKLGHLDPVSEVTGMQARLANLGYDCGPVDGDFGPRTRAALEQFQRDNDLRITGDADDATRKKLEERHGS